MFMVSFISCQTFTKTRDVHFAVILGSVMRTFFRKPPTTKKAVRTKSVEKVVDERKSIWVANEINFVLCHDEVQLPMENNNRNFSVRVILSHLLMREGTNN